MVSDCSEEEVGSGLSVMRHVGLWSSDFSITNHTNKRTLSTTENKQTQFCEERNDTETTITHWYGESEWESWWEANRGTCSALAFTASRLEELSDCRILPELPVVACKVMNLKGFWICQKFIAGETVCLGFPHLGKQWKTHLSTRSDGETATYKKAFP